MHEVGGLELGIVGGKGFVGGFPGAELPDFGEPLLREVYAETTREVDALEAGLEQVSGCHRRVVLLHYAPIPETLVGEPETIWAFLGSSRLAAPIGAHRPDLVLHGHAHRGTFAGELGPVPVRNVAVHVIGKDFELFDALASGELERRPPARDVLVVAQQRQPEQQEGGADRELAREQAGDVAERGAGDDLAPRLDGVRHRQDLRDRAHPARAGRRAAR